MTDLRKRFVKCKGEYHQLTLEDVQHFKTHKEWPDDYQEINWEEERDNFATLWEFLGTKLPHERTKTIAILADRLGIPFIKIDSPDGLYKINAYPKYWLIEMFGQSSNPIENANQPFD